METYEKIETVKGIVEKYVNERHSSLKYKYFNRLSNCFSSYLILNLPIPSSSLLCKYFCITSRCILSFECNSVILFNTFEYYHYIQLNKWRIQFFSDIIIIISAPLEFWSHAIFVQSLWLQVLTAA